MSLVEVQKVKTLTGHRDCIYTIERSNDTNIFFSASGDGMVARWDINEEDTGQLLAQVNSSVYALNYVLEENILIIGKNFDGLHIIDVAQKKEVRSLHLTKSAIFDIKTFEGKVFIATGDGRIIVVELETLKTLWSVQASEKSARTIAINPLKRHLAVGFSDNSVRIYDLDDFTPVTTLTDHKNSVFSVRYSPDYRFLISAGRDAHLRIWNALDGYNLYETIVAHMYAINHIDYSPNGKYFVTCSMDKSIKVWDAERFKLLKVIDKARHAGHGTSINKLIWSEFNNFLISCSDDRTISIWDLKFNNQ